MSDNEDIFLTTGEAADAIPWLSGKTSHRTIVRWCKQGKLKCVVHSGFESQHGKRYLVRLSELEKFLDKLNS